MGKARPGEAGIAARDMHFFWLVDCSGSMNIAGKIQALNTAIDEALPAMKDVARENPFAKISVRAIKFSSGAQWHVAQPTAVEDFNWPSLTADGVTDMGAAFTLVAEQLSVEKLGTRGFPPVLVLLSDGQPTDDYKKGLKDLMDQPWGKRAARIAIAIGQDADEEPLRDFIGNIEFPVLQANNAERLKDLIKWASATVSQGISSPASKTKESAETGPIDLPPPPAPNEADPNDAVW